MTPFPNLITIQKTKNMEKENFLSLFADCKLTKGYARTLAVDTTRGKTFVLSNDAYEFITDCKSRTYNEVLSDYSSEEQAGVKELVRYLIQNDLCFFTDIPEIFPEISEQWDTPSIITNAIIDIDEDMPDFELIIPQLTELGCYDIQLRFYSVYSFKEIEELVEFISATSIKSVELYVKSATDFSKKALKNLTKRFFKIKNVIIHSHHYNEAYIVYEGRYRNNMGNILFVKQEVTDETHCGAISTHYFVRDNLQFYNEGLHYNSCLNRKISIDKKGEIRNCPSMKKSFGYYKDTQLSVALNHPEFKENWEISKRQISVCQDCEYRNVCVDCRAYTQDSKNNDAKPLKCNYDPYKAEWISRPEKKLNYKNA